MRSVQSHEVVTPRLASGGAASGGAPAAAAGHVAPDRGIDVWRVGATACGIGAARGPGSAVSLPPPACGRVDYWRARGTAKHPVLLTVIPSLSFDPGLLRTIPGAALYESRELANLLLAYREDFKVDLVSSVALDPDELKYYMTLLPPPDLRRLVERLNRVRLFSPDVPLRQAAAVDPNYIPLSERLLRDERLLAAMRARRRDIAPDDDIGASFVVGGPTEDRLAAALALPALQRPPVTRGPHGCDWGSRLDSRTIFERSGVAMPRGVLDSRGRERLFQSPEELAAGIAQLLQEDPDIQRVMIKLNDGFSGEGFFGEGNAILDASGFSAALRAGDRRVLQESVLARLPTLRLPACEWPEFSRLIAAKGCIVEEYVQGAGKRATMARGIVCDDGRVETLMTYDQILDDASFVYRGCTLPGAAPSYRRRMEIALECVGRELHEEGFCGEFGVNFIAVPEGDPEDPATEWEIGALAINLRHGGGTAPRLFMELLTEGQLDPCDGLFRDPSGQEKFAYASDNLVDPAFKSISISCLVRAVRRTPEIHFNAETRTGTVFQMLPLLPTHGMVGCICIGNSPEAARAQFEATKIFMEHLAVQEASRAAGGGE